MSKKYPPYVLIDDEIEKALPPLADAVGARNVYAISYPDDLENGNAPKSIAALRRADVVLVDHDLRDRSRGAKFLEPRYGRALLELIPGLTVQRTSSQGAKLQARTAAWVVFSAKLDQLVKYSPTVGYAAPIRGREHAVARMSGVDWIISKTQNERPPSQKSLSVLGELQAAVAESKRRRHYAVKNPAGFLETLMALPQGTWLRSARRSYRTNASPPAGH